MKRESVLMLIAGIFLGAVLSFIVTREYYRNPGDSSAVKHNHPESAMGSQSAMGSDSANPGFDMKQHEKMMQEMKDYLDNHPEDVEKRRSLANIFYDSGNFTEAVPLYEEVLEKEPENTDVMVDLGRCYREVGRTDDALAKFNQALKIEPDKKQALFNKAVILGIDKHDINGAEEILDKLRRDYPGEPAIDELSKALNHKSK